MCDHNNVVRLSDGWYCLDCKQMFDQKPLPPKVEVKEEKPKKTKKKAEK